MQTYAKKSDDIKSIAQRKKADSWDVAQLREDEDEVESGEYAPNNTGIPDQTKSKFESMTGMSLDDVRVNYNSDKPAQMQAHAYTQGNDIHIAPGQEQHLEHELGHVVQQKQGRVSPTGEIGGVAINDDESLENEAD
ncbi:MAG: DUF4157 domain-containing protein, partial [Oscillospiraceae bacterium]|nr:DUF4157 domain-containing protein [Oscillospiraceae bacterium]